MLLLFPNLHHMQKLRKRETKDVLHKLVESLPGFFSILTELVLIPKKTSGKFNSKVF